MTNERMTKKDWFAEIAKLVEASEVERKEEMLGFIEHEVELLSKKRSSTNTKKDKENEALCEQIEKALAEIGRPVTITEFMKESTAEVATLSNQKLSALLKKCKEERGTVDKTVEKKKSYFFLVEKE